MSSAQSPSETDKGKRADWLSPLLLGPTSRAKLLIIFAPLNPVATLALLGCLSGEAAV